MILKSRKNLVRTVEHCGGLAVRKLFDSPDGWQRECLWMQRLRGHVHLPEVFARAPGLLLMEYLPYPTLLEVLEEQERTSFAPEPWRALCRWLERVHAAGKCVPGDGNLRNFLWDGTNLWGVDFEDYRPGTLREAAREIAAYILEYTPAGTAVKRDAAHLLAAHWQLTDDEITSARGALRQRRLQTAGASDPDCTYLLLAGGRSRRMGRDKALLKLCGSTFLELQLDKARLLGIRDVLVSGRLEVGDVCGIPDALPDRGPLGGIQTGLRRAAHPRCIVLSIDTPLLPACALREMLSFHCLGDAPLTLAVHGGQIEPLTGIYDTSTLSQIDPLIRERGAPVRALLDVLPWRGFDPRLPEELWLNCNTPENFASITDP